MIEINSQNKIFSCVFFFLPFKKGFKQTKEDSFIFSILTFSYIYLYKYEYKNSRLGQWVSRYLGTPLGFTLSGVESKPMVEER